MDLYINTQNGKIGMISTLLSLIFGAITWQGVETFVKIVAAMGSVISITLAIVYWTLAIKEKKQAIKRHKGYK